MRHVFTLFAFALMSSMSAQTVLPPHYPYNPDSDGDEFVAVSDVLMSVASYDNEFQAQSIMVDTLSLEEAIQLLLQQQILNQQALIQSQQDLIEGLTNSLEGVQGFEPCLLNWTCGCPLTYQGYDYATIQIGEQCWFAENLRSVQYRNGDEIPGDIAEVAWSELTEGAQAVFGQNEVNCIIGGGWSFPTDSFFQPCDETWSLATYGRLYNSYAVVDPRGVCPSGWHVWTYAEAQQVISHVGGISVAGVKLKASSDDDPNWNGTNDYGFSAVPNGIYSGGSIVLAGTYGYIWTARSSHRY